MANSAAWSPDNRYLVVGQGAAYNVYDWISGTPTKVTMAMLALREAGFHWSSTVIWMKDSLVLSRKDYYTQYEPIWYGWLEGKRLCPLTDRKQSDVWQIPRPKKSDLHPTMKPLALVARAIMKDKFLDCGLAVRK